MNARSRVALLGALLLSQSWLIASAAPGPGLEAYQRAEATRADKIVAHGLNLTVVPIWAPHSDRFWFREQSSDGWRYIAVDPDRHDRQPAFDHAGLARAISQVTQQPVDADHLPLGNPVIDDSAGHQVSFEVSGKALQCDVVSPKCAAVERVSPAVAMADL
jgi:hypothetical protein